MYLYRFPRTSWLRAGTILVIALPAFAAIAGYPGESRPLRLSPPRQEAIPNGLVGAGIDTFAETQLA